MRECSKCGSTERQHKIGLTAAGSQRYKCQPCGSKYTPPPAQRGYPEAVRQQAVRMYLDGLNFRRIGRLLGVDHVSVMNWVNAYADKVEDAPMPATAETVEMDELYTFVGSKKTDSTS